MAEEQCSNIVILGIPVDEQAMENEMHTIHAVANIVWRSTKELGKILPPSDSTRFAATARFIEDNALNLFSVVLYYPSPHLRQASSFHQETKMHFFAPELVMPRLQIGSKLYITDGIKIVADVKIMKIK